MTFKKDDHSKPRYDLIPPHAELELAHVLTYGAEKYGANNWHQGGPESIPRYIAAAQRHIAAYRRGEKLDGESGLPHLAHAVASLMFVLEFEADRVVGDEEPRKVWNMGEGKYTVEVFDDSGTFFANLLEDRHVAHVVGDCSGVFAALSNLKNKCVSVSGRGFMDNAIAAYERESGEVEAETAGPRKVWSSGCKNGTSITVWSDGERFSGELAYNGEVIKRAEQKKSVLDVLGRIRFECTLDEYCDFMDRVISKYRRESAA